MVELPTFELNLELCVSSGQVFRWEQLEEGRWLGVEGPNWYLVEVRSSGPLGDQACVNRERSAPERGADDGAWTHFYVESNASENAFRAFFRLEHRLTQIERQILTRGPELEPYIARLPGLRVLRPSDPEEVLFSFLCTPNNNIRRITGMVRSLAEFGEPIGLVGGREVHRFPSVERIARIPESELRSRGFGYRARTIPSVARRLLEKPRGWLASLGSMGYERAHAELCTLDGVGPKLADCVCLFGLHYLQAAPVDTHLWKAARKLYFPQWEGTTLTEAKYREIGEFLRNRFGSLTGWAHQYLFYSNLLVRSRREGSG